jgi:beta-glucosidase
MDIYVEPFYRAIHDGNVGAIMSGYNAINNIYCDENHFILTDVLRGILKFKGFVMSDWWGVYSNHSNTINSGLDMNMPGGYTENSNDEEHKYDNVGRNHSHWTHLEDYIEKNLVKEERIKEAATRIIATMYQMNQMEDYPNVDLYKETKNDENKKLQRKAATESQVLLKNEGILPLQSKNLSIIAIIGNDAFEQDCEKASDQSCRNETNEVFNGHIPLGYGSGTTDFSYLITPAEGIKKYAQKYNISVIESGKLIYGDEERDGKIVHVNATEDIDGGINAAKKADLCVIFVASTSGEEYLVVENSIGDRADLDVLHNGNDLIEKVAEVNENVIVVINSPSVVNLPWRNKVKGIIYSGFPGSESGNAIADILFGEVNPSGHLPFVWGEYDDYPVKIDHLNNLTIYDKETGKTWKDIFHYDGVDSAGLQDDEPGHDKEQYNYTEGLYIGQRWFNKHNIKPIFPFGFGLSYSTFEYSNLQVSINKDGLFATFNIKNNSTRTGQAVPMMFLTFPSDIGDYPKHIFKGFEKVEILPNEVKTVTISADDHALSYFNENKNDYVRINNGIIKVSIAENGDPEQAFLNKEIEASF